MDDILLNKYPNMINNKWLHIYSAMLRFISVSDVTEALNSIDERKEFYAYEVTSCEKNTEASLASSLGINKQTIQGIFIDSVEQEENSLKWSFGNWKLQKYGTKLIFYNNKEQYFPEKIEAIDTHDNSPKNNKERLLAFLFTLKKDSQEIQIVISEKFHE